MGSIRSSVEDGFGGFDLNSAAVDFEHQEPSNEAEEAEPLAGPIEDLDRGGESRAETRDGLGHDQKVETDAKVVDVVGGAGDEPNPEGVSAEVEDIGNGSKRMDNGVSFSEEKQSTGDGMVGHDMVDVDEAPSQLEVVVEFTSITNGASLGLNQSTYAEAVGGGSVASNLINRGDITNAESESTVQSSKPEQENPMLGDGVTDASNNGEQEPLEGTEKETVEPAAIWHAGNYFPSQEGKATFSVSDMVWGKVKSYPWWPGEIFDPSDASDMALKHQKEDKLLIAYFGDKTFAWNDESQLKPFYTNFSRMEKQSNLDSFADAVNAALGEVSRRVELGMTCSCFADEAYSNMKHQKVENTGIQEGTHKSAADGSLVVNSFQPKRLLQIIEALAQLPCGGADRLELVIAKAQLKAFYHSKGHPELPVVLDGGMLLENDSEPSPIKTKKSGKNIADHSTSSPSDSYFGKRKLRGRTSSSSKHDHNSEDGKDQKRLSKPMEGKHDPHLANGGKRGFKGKALSRSSVKKRKVADSDSSDSGKCKKKRIGSLGDLETKTPPRSYKVGKNIRQVASQLIGSPSIHKSNGEAKHAAKVNRGRGDVLAIDDTTRTHAETSRNDALEVYSSPSEMLSLLCLAAMDPMGGYNFLPVIISYFTGFRCSPPSTSPMDIEYLESVGGKGGRRKSANATSAPTKLTTRDNIQDSYWSDISFHNSPVKEPASSGLKRKEKSLSLRRKKKMKHVGEEPSHTLPSDAMLGSPQHLQGGSPNPSTKLESTEERPTSDPGERIAVEYTPTALILSFTESSALPSKTNLLNFFSSYGPLEEADTEVLKKTNRVKVVFRKCADAERAYSSAGKYSIFGPSLVSYRLRYLTSTPKASPDAKQKKKDASHIEGGNLKIPVSDNRQVEGAGN